MSSRREEQGQGVFFFPLISLMFVLNGFDRAMVKGASLFEFWDLAEVTSLFDDCSLPGFSYMKMRTNFMKS